MSTFYVATAIPYVNAELHIGNALDLITADVLARYMRQQNVPTFFSTGTDEHGGKIAEKAAEQKIEPKIFADQMSQHFLKLLQTLNISNDVMIRTTDPVHEKGAQYAWSVLAKAGYISPGTYSGWYCTGDEEFFTEEVVRRNKGICPDHNRPYEKVDEQNYIFKLSAFTKPILAAIEKGDMVILPDTRRNEILSLLKSGLEDISISRPSDKISWGIPVPGDPKQVMYVWFEALLNYITALGYPNGVKFKQFWPANVQVIGKGILRFHAAIWPAILMGLGLPVYKTLYVHGYITVDGKKIGKSLGNAIAPGEIVAKYGSEAFRYFFLRHIPSYTDGDFSWSRMEAAYNDELADQLGNAVSRTAAMISKYLEGAVGNMPESEHDIGPYQQALESCRFDKALEEVWEQVKGLNQYIDETKPWEIAKTNDLDHLREVLAYAAASLLEVADLLVPFMPETAGKIKDSFGTGILRPLPGPLFPKAEKPAQA